MLKLGEGFAGQDMFVIPRPILEHVKRHPLVRSVYPTDIGWFPNAMHHYRNRPEGAYQHHLIVCVAGNGHAVVDDQEVQVSAGQFLIIPKGVRHRYWAASGDPWSIYWLHFLGEDVEYYIERIPFAGQPLGIEPEERAELVHLFRCCLNSLHEGYGLHTLIYAAQSVQHILSLLLYRNRSLPTDARQRDHVTKVECVVEHMQNHLTEPLHLDDFARVAGMSVSHFSELFRHQTGQSPMTYFVHVRIRHACRLLDLSRKPIKVVAVESGFKDPYYFSRVFKKVMGISPERYREIKKG